MNIKRVAELDGLRGIAISLVLLWHYLGGPLNLELTSHRAFTLLELGGSGVDLFFVLSGFLLGGILIDNKDSINMFRVFYIRRCCRIFPLYYLWILIFVVIVYCIKEVAYEFPYILLFDIKFNHTISLTHYLTFTQNFIMALNHDWASQWFGMTWSLAVEEQFYLVLPLIIYFTSARILPFLLLFLIVLAPVLRTFLFYQLSPANGIYWGFFLMPCRCDSLLLGVLCALALRNNGFKDFVHRKILAVYAMVMILFGMIYSIGFNGLSGFTAEMTWYGYSLLALFYSCVLIIAVTEKRGLITAIVRNQWLGKLGVISYGVYIFHQGVQFLVHAWFFHDEPQITGIPTALASIFALFLTFLLAWVSWTYFEKPIVNFGHDLVYKKRQ